jgi:3-oxoacyl-[acyl-carrier-protein] synthase II
MTEAVVVTGMGVVSPLGEGIRANWETLTEPSSGLRPLRRDLCFARSEAIGPATHRTDGLPKGRRPTSCIDVGPRPLGRGRRSPGEGLLSATKLANVASSEALQDAGLWDGRSLQNMAPSRLGCTVSASKPLFASPGISAPSPYGRGASEAWGEAASVVPPEAVNDFISEQFNLQGERRNVIAACATGAYSIALAASWIEQGVCDVVLAGSVEPYPHPLIEAGFRRMGVTSSEGVTRPFDQRRTGFTFGEGAGVVVLESSVSAKRRQARVHARLSGWALGSDSHSAVAFNSNGQRVAHVIGRAVTRAKLAQTAISHVHAHGTATRLNDRIETQALINAFGPHAGNLMISATKGSTGHLLGASGSVEFVYTVLALKNQFIPPTAHLETLDPECPLDYTPLKGRHASFKHALSLSFGFGGPIGALVVSRE